MQLITMQHGSGGSVMNSLIKEKILKHLGKVSNPKIEISLADLDDAGVIDGIVFTTDSHTVKPIFFPNGDIGSLSIAGTINDIAVLGADVLALSSAFVIEEGFSMEELEKILISMKKTCKKANVPIITGDTKVVEKNALDKIIINTCGIGKGGKALQENIKEVKRYRKFNEKWLKDSNLKEGDKIILSGNIAEHGIAILSFREGYGFEGKVKSDVCPLNKMIEKILTEGGITAMKDPTRGGLANTLNEFSEKSKVGILIEEEKIPISEEVKNASEMLGIDPLEVGNEGKVVIGVVKEKAESILKVLRRTKEGKNAEIIGKCDKKIKGVVMETLVGGKRIIEQPIGDPVPRIC